MRPIVLDASVAAAWVLPDERSDFADNLFAQVCLQSGQYHAPALWLTEVGNLLLSAMRRQRLDLAGVHQGWDLLAQCQLQFAAWPPVRKQAQILRLALTHGLSFYDAHYLELVLSLNGQLVSQDKKLVNAAKSCGVFCIDF